MNIKIDPRRIWRGENSLVNQSNIEIFNFTDDFEIHIQKGHHDFSNDSPYVLIKNPEIKLIGNAKDLCN